MARENGVEYRHGGEAIGVEHRPVAEEAAHVLPSGPAATLSTGNVVDERTIEHPRRI